MANLLKTKYNKAVSWMLNALVVVLIAHGALYYFKINATQLAEEYLQQAADATQDLALKYKLDDLSRGKYSDSKIRTTLLAWKASIDARDSIKAEAINGIEAIKTLEKSDSLIFNDGLVLSNEVIESIINFDDTFGNLLFSQYKVLHGGEEIYSFPEMQRNIGFFRDASRPKITAIDVVDVDYIKHLWSFAEPANVARKLGVPSFLAAPVVWALNSTLAITGKGASSILVPLIALALILFFFKPATVGKNQKEDKEEGTAEVEKTEAPAEVEKTEAPAEVEKTEAPAEVEKTEAPAKKTISPSNIKAIKEKLKQNRKR